MVCYDVFIKCSRGLSITYTWVWSCRAAACEVKSMCVMLREHVCHVLDLGHFWEAQPILWPKLLLLIIDVEVLHADRHRRPALKSQLS